MHIGNALPTYQQIDQSAVYPYAYRERGLHENAKPVGYRFIPMHIGNALIITYCKLIKIVNIKFPPSFC